MSKSNLNRIFHALLAHHRARGWITRRAARRIALIGVRDFPDFHRF